ncbi:Eukaryotic translation initiation factor 3 subunit B [Oopsacas minuta]|uniref:Eukaryotic translation initiation factor 3 subunit B n=1 Tax=Oopsacas minuta TaxID=111878 RepID=A0AAV7KCR8_9METZ|nr:Eukaryotic translation initiation factor 3 subunit B [Oopsacas minuta]
MSEFPKQGGISTGDGMYGILKTLGSDEEADSSTPELSDDEGYVECISDIDILNKLKEIHKPNEAETIMLHHRLESPEVSKEFDSIIIVENIPQIDPKGEKMEKLEIILRKIFSRFGKIVNIYFAKETNAMLKGFMLVEYQSSDSAEQAKKIADGYIMDKSHTFTINLMTEVVEALGMSDEFKEQTPLAYPGERQGPLWWWAMKEDAHDQYAILHQGSNTDLSNSDVHLSLWWNTGSVPRYIVERLKWSMLGFTWSKQGTFLVTVHPQGAAIWAFESFERFQKYPHFGVKLVDISPGENYVVTCSLPQSEDDQNVKIWNLLTAKVVKTFSVESVVIYPGGRDKPAKWPLIQWSYNDEYFGILSLANQSIKVFQSDCMKLLDDKVIHIPNIQDFSWRPTGSNVLAYWFPEQNQKPAQVALMSIPTRAIARQKNLVGVHDCELKWTENGRFLLCKVIHYISKSRKQNKTKTAFEVFSIGQDREIPVISIDAGESVTAYALDQNGNKIAVMSSEATKDVIGHQSTLKFFSVDPSRASNPFLKDMTGVYASHLSWSPLGQYLVAAAISQNTGDLIFIDATEFSVINRQNHTGFTDIQWDPTGRYLCSYINYMTRATECSYALWTFYGRCYYKFTIPFLYAFKWRGRPPKVLTEGEQLEIQKNIAYYQKIFEQKDKKAQRNEADKLFKKYRAMFNDFMDVKNCIKDRLHELETSLNKRLDSTMDEENFDIEIVESFDKEKVEIIK